MSIRPLDVLATLEGIGVSKELRDAFFEAVEDYTVLSIKQLNDAMRSAGLSVDQRVAVKKSLESPPPPAAVPTVSVAAADHSEARFPRSRPVLFGCDS